MTANVTVIIPAGGRGDRLGNKTPKQLILLDDRSVMEHTIRRFLEIETVAEIIIACHQDILEPVRKMCTQMNSNVPIHFAPGGRERQDSVWSAMLIANPSFPYIAIHDAVRPFFPKNILTDGLKMLQDSSGLIAASPLVHTIKRAENNIILETLPRQQLWEIHTPQLFHRKILFRAHHAAQRDQFYGTDDAILAERIGEKITIFPDTNENIKITYPADLVLAKYFLKRKKQ
ncbi:MAG TPA: 2-C-methyl-D-erythritol 4-phosphate cytidylyltransferase [Candidatus Marinimicrobia bacterium]|nr:2-C-methyl-D-erythritol 4-phosphate cytidylyltransferase [Candidatus Neomarinimicrobiota bacterium]